MWLGTNRFYLAIQLSKCQRRKHRRRLKQINPLLSLIINLQQNKTQNIVVKVQFRGPELFKKKGGTISRRILPRPPCLVVDVVIMTSQCRCTRALSQSHVAKHDNHVPVAPLIGSGLGVMSMQWLPYGKIISAKTLKLHSTRGHPFTIVSPTCSRRHNDTR